MTAFARSATEGAWGRAVWELRSVNHRYLELAVRLPEELRSLETRVREMVALRLTRGKIDCNLRYSAAAGAAIEFTINKPAVELLLSAAREVAELAGPTQPLNPFDVLRYPGVLETPEVDLEQVSSAILEGLRLAIEQLADTRAREGDKIMALVETRCDAIEAQLEILRRRVPDIMRALRERHEQRIRDLASGLDESRIEQECALLIQRLDVAEEMDRLAAHLQEIRRLLRQPGPVGRRLDFLMQELHREANTLASKSAHIDMTNGSVELKVLIEQIREQIQNLE